MVGECVQKNDGDLVLLNDGSSCILYNLQVGITLVGTHPTPMLFRRGEQLIDVEFTFWLRAALLIKTYTTIRAFGCLIRNLASHIKIKSCLRRSVESSSKVKSALLKESSSRKINVSADTIPSKNIEHFKNKVNLKKVLLRKLKEMMDEDG